MDKIISKNQSFQVSGNYLLRTDYWKIARALGKNGCNLWSSCLKLLLSPLPKVQSMRTAVFQPKAGKPVPLCIKVKNQFSGRWKLPVRLAEGVGHGRDEQGKPVALQDQACSLSWGKK